ncbi:MAG: hypothetical protein UW68_C0012G0019 [Candidatus Collierbacteria bacterium GW2011_GWB1_44_6]|uniref:Uncharacterized protein n=2 Tax=Candidatus Collieribacteriota TaxID=1752725 RepID=A0A0G1JP40_9BACT|nr:MAG: hypothetical protein UV68_C0027G0009 [Candidatus Collierbacteria bacterium GW2011_GWC2_43_12]KKT73326.1 MAG: hypothetical protein UW68_C0012G0019 [Candidatus Collierbacteria bacterium GW2011_GWB1_44_6]KKT82668.1 MAG: hypothetical protein UW80_C0033G0013 [Microgenomates group bacterium GW2011_GWC1_44_9]
MVVNVSNSVRSFAGGNSDSGLTFGFDRVDGLVANSGRKIDLAGELYIWIGYCDFRLAGGDLGDFVDDVTASCGRNVGG